jgi:hypothetical protein
MSNIVKALQLKYESEIESARANIDVYMSNPSGIGEHPDLVSAVDSELIKLSTAEDKLNSLKKNYGRENHFSATQSAEYLYESDMGNINPLKVQGELDLD